MSIGVGIFLFVVGAILAFALNVDVGWVNLDLAGYIFMGAGAVVAVIGTVLLARRRTSVVTERQSPDGLKREQIVSETRDETDTRI